MLWWCSCWVNSDLSSTLSATVRCWGCQAPCLPLRPSPPSGTDPDPVIGPSCLWLWVTSVSSSTFPWISLTSYLLWKEMRTEGAHQLQEQPSVVPCRDVPSRVILCSTLAFGVLRATICPPSGRKGAITPWESTWAPGSPLCDLQFLKAQTLPLTQPCPLIPVFRLSPGPLTWGHQLHGSLWLMLLLAPTKEPGSPWKLSPSSAVSLPLA